MEKTKWRERHRAAFEFLVDWLSLSVSIFIIAMLLKWLGVIP